MLEEEEEEEKSFRAVKESC